MSSGAVFEVPSGKNQYIWKNLDWNQNNRKYKNQI